MRRLACLLALCVALTPLRGAAGPLRGASAPHAAAGPHGGVTPVRGPTALLGATAPAPAAADSPVPGDRSNDRGVVLVQPPRVEGVAGAQAVEGMRTALRAGLARAELTVVEPASGAAECDDADCRAAAARTAGADHIVELEVRAVDRDFELRVRLIDVATGEVRELAEGCTICGLGDATALAESLGARLGPMYRAATEEAAARRAQEQALREQPRLRVVSKPAGATVLVDGQKVGVTPLEQPVAAGQHVVELRRAGYLGETREVVSTRGALSELTLSLRSDRPPPTARSRALLISGSTAIGLGVGGLAVMAAGLGRGAAAERDGAAKVAELDAAGIDGLERTDALADIRSRGQRADTMAIAGAVVGGVLLVAGVTLVVVSTTPRARRVALAPWGGPHGAGVSLGGRF